MESQKPKIALYVKRPFGDKLNATMDFIKENWKPMLKFCTYLILPLCLIQAISMNGIMGGAMGIAAAKEAGTNSLAAIGMQFWVNYGLMFLCYLVGSILLTSIIYGLMQVYNQREERLAGVTFADLKPFLFKNIRRLLVMVLFCIGLTSGGHCYGDSGCSFSVHAFAYYSVADSLCSAVSLVYSDLLVRGDRHSCSFLENFPSGICHMGRCLFSISGHGFDIQCIAGSYYDSVVYCHYRKILLYAERYTE